MSTSKCEKSEHRKEIDEAAKNGMSARKISDMLLVKFNEHMSHTAIHNYLDKSKSLDEESAIEAVENLEKRVRNLELNAVTYGPNGSDNGWNTYSLAGTQSHALSRMDVLTDAIPDSDSIEAEFKSLQKSCIAKRQKEDGLALSDAEFVAQRAANAKAENEAVEQEKKAKEERMMQAAEDELLRRKKDQENLLKVIEENAKKAERRSRLNELRNKELEERAGIDSEGNSIR